MSKRKARSAVAALPEKRSVETLTVAWMLTVMTALTCELVSLGIYLYHEYTRPASENLRTFSLFLLFAAIVLGFIVLITTPVVVRARRRAPPRGITIFALLVGAAPIVAMCYLSMVR